MADSIVRLPAFRVSFHPVPSRNGPGVTWPMLWTDGIHCFVCSRSARTEKTRSGVARMTAVLVNDMAHRGYWSVLNQTEAGPLSTPLSPANFDARGASSAPTSEGTTSNAGEPPPSGGIDRRG